MRSGPRSTDRRRAAADRPSVRRPSSHLRAPQAFVCIILYELMTTNQDWIRYEGVEKRQTYHLAESAEEQFDDDFVIRTCDMRPPTFAPHLGDALREIGFAILDGHGVDPALYDLAEAKVLEMFGRLSLEDKMRFQIGRASCRERV